MNLGSMFGTTTSLTEGWTLILTFRATLHFERPCISSNRSGLRSGTPYEFHDPRRSFQPILSFVPPTSSDPVFLDAQNFPSLYDHPHVVAYGNITPSNMIIEINMESLEGTAGESKPRSHLTTSSPGVR